MNEEKEEVLTKIGFAIVDGNNAIPQEKFMDVDIQLSNRYYLKAIAIGIKYLVDQTGKKK